MIFSYVNWCYIWEKNACQYQSIITIPCRKCLTNCMRQILKKEANLKTISEWICWTVNDLIWCVIAGHDSVDCHHHNLVLRTFRLCERFPCWKTLTLWTAAAAPNWKTGNLPTLSSYFENGLVWISLGLTINLHSLMSLRFCCKDLGDQPLGSCFTMPETLANK